MLARHVPGNCLLRSRTTGFEIPSGVWTGASAWDITAKQDFTCSGTGVPRYERRSGLSTRPMRCNKTRFHLRRDWSPALRHWSAVPNRSPVVGTGQCARHMPGNCLLRSPTTGFEIPSGVWTGASAWHMAGYRLPVSRVTSNSPAIVSTEFPPTNSGNFPGSTVYFMFSS